MSNEHESMMGILKLYELRSEAVPTILTGIITALLKRLIVKPQGKLVSPRQS